MNQSLKTNKEILSIDTNKFQKNKVSINRLPLYPVLTISNNSDRDRKQYSDSYVVICYKDKIVNNSNNNIARELESRHAEYGNESLKYSNNNENNFRRRYPNVI